MKNKTTYSVQEWLPFEKILNNGIIKLKNLNYIKILEIIPINFNLKSELEKEAILNSYKIFLKTCNFNFQILIQSKKEDLTNHISKINFKKNKENKKIKIISENYINYIKNLNLNKKSSNKNFYIILKNNIEENKTENIIIEELNDKYFKIKECLARCGNSVIEIQDKKELREILNSFFNYKNYINSINVRRKENF